MDRTARLPIDERLVRVDTDRVALYGMLRQPEGTGGVVLFAHGSGSSRNSPRNIRVARILNEAGLATLLIDLLSPNEEPVGIGLLTDRLVSATDWLADRLGLPIGYFGASTGAAAALVAAARRATAVAAIVARGGRPDLAGAALRDVRAPTLLIVGGHDVEVIELNRIALQELRCEKQLVIVLGATHLFEEPGALDEVARVARAWFERHLTSAWDATGTAD